MILVTSAAGFVGCKVSEFLLEEGQAVVGVDNLNNAYDVHLKERRLSRLLGKPEFTFHRLDITDRQELTQLFQHNSFEAVINLAARAGVRESLKDPWVYYETNVLGTLNLLELCKEYRVKKFALASTSSVYGVPSLHYEHRPKDLSKHNNPDKLARPFREDQPTDRPLSPYAASKRAAETLCYTYHYLYDLDITVLRYFTVYGPAGRPDMSIFRFIKWIAEEEPVIVYGDGIQERDFTYVDDIAQGTLAALKPMGYEVINLGSDRPVRLLEVIQLIKELLGHKAGIKYESPHLADVPATRADISKARKLLAWDPQITLEEGLRRAVEWYKANRDWANEIEVDRT